MSITNQRIVKRNTENCKICAGNMVDVLSLKLSFLCTNYRLLSMEQFDQTSVLQEKRFFF
jgi:hypothetical protein